MKILLAGGSKSGKSMLAQRLVRRLAGSGPMYYWAPMEPTDEEDKARIKNHIAERAGWGFETIECGSGLKRMLPLQPGASVLFDSVTALVANEMFKDGRAVEGAFEASLKELSELIESVDNIVFVCDEVFRDGEEYGSLTEEYRKNLALICRELAQRCDAVCEVVCGKAHAVKGSLPRMEESV